MRLAALAYRQAVVVAHQVVDLVNAIASGEQPRPSFDDGLHVQRVLDAVEQSSLAGSAWTATS